MRKQWVINLGAAMLAGAVGSALLGPAPVGAVAREIVELQTSVNQLIQGQQALQTQMTQSEAVEKTLIEQSLDSVNKLSGTMNSLQKSVQDLQANSGARLDSMSTQVQGVSDNLQESLARMGKLNQQLTDIQNSIQGIDSKLSTGAAAPSPAASMPPGAPNGSTPNGSMPNGAPNTGSASGMPPTAPEYAASPYVPSGSPAGSAPLPSADLLYSNGLRDYSGRKYDLATQEFQDYLKYYPTTELASNAEFYLGQIAYSQEQYQQAIDAFSKVIDNYPKSFKLAPAHLLKGLALVASGQKASGIRELRLVIHNYPGTDEERRARTKLHDMGLTA
jgi:tol-pal system protein YbgF